ncbi:hypothetical protein N7454_002724 [Penicillium verhagenii]|nr:hypothetical protein N7454_002724 [Penicillium verhagenii]
MRTGRVQHPNQRKEPTLTECPQNGPVKGTTGASSSSQSPAKFSTSNAKPAESHHQLVSNNKKSSAASPRRSPGFTAWMEGVSRLPEWLNQRVAANGRIVPISSRFSRAEDPFNNNEFARNVPSRHQEGVNSPGGENIDHRRMPIMQPSINSQFGQAQLGINDSTSLILPTYMSGPVSPTLRANFLETKNEDSYEMPEEHSIPILLNSMPSLFHNMILPGNGLESHELWDSGHGIHTTDSMTLDVIAWVNHKVRASDGNCSLMRLAADEIQFQYEKTDETLMRVNYLAAIKPKTRPELRDRRIANIHMKQALLAGLTKLRTGVQAIEMQDNYVIVPVPYGEGWQLGLAPAAVDPNMGSTYMSPDFWSSMSGYFVAEPVCPMTVPLMTGYPMPTHHFSAGGDVVVASTNTGAMNRAIPITSERQTDIGDVSNSSSDDGSVDLAAGFLEKAQSIQATNAKDLAFQDEFNGDRASDISRMSAMGVDGCYDECSTRPESELVDHRLERPIPVAEPGSDEPVNGFDAESAGPWWPNESPDLEGELLSPDGPDPTRWGWGSDQADVGDDLRDSSLRENGEDGEDGVDGEDRVDDDNEEDDHSNGYLDEEDGHSNGNLDDEEFPDLNDYGENDLDQWMFGLILLGGRWVDVGPIRYPFTEANVSMVGAFGEMIPISHLNRQLYYTNGDTEENGVDGNINGHANERNGEGGDDGWDPSNENEETLVHVEENGVNGENGDHNGDHNDNNAERVVNGAGGTAELEGPVLNGNPVE